jgi:hypothetical protein
MYECARHESAETKVVSRIYWWLVIPSFVGAFHDLAPLFGYSEVESKVWLVQLENTLMQVRLCNALHLFTFG